MIASKAKKFKFDPVSQKQTYHSRKNTAQLIRDACSQFLTALSEATSTDCNTILFTELSNAERELVLVSMLSLSAVSALKRAMEVVSSGLGREDRLQFISNIVTVQQENHAPDILSVPTRDVHSFLPHSDKINYFQQDGDALRKASYTFGSAHTSFLVPPVSCCINQECRHYSKSLYRHHPPTAVTVFTLNGPIPATKINLKCCDCNTIYNQRSIIMN